jgi:hypothetical protein
MKVKAISYTIFVSAILLMLGTGCDRPAKNTPTASLPARPTATTNGLPDEAVSTLSSLEKIDDYPLYVMHYAGDYSYPQLTSLPSEIKPFGCSLFAGLGEGGDKLYGRNFDWDYSPALLVFTDPPDGYASASMVDLSFLGIAVDKATRLLDLPLASRSELLGAPSMPFDGMNEYGLAIGMAAVPEEYAEDASYDASRQTIGSIGIIRQALDHARNVDEAVKIFGEYNIVFAGGPPIHYLIADASGKATLVEFYQGEMVVLPNKDAWHLATNHLRCIAEGDGGCWRYSILSVRLKTLQGQLDTASAMQLLSDVKQDATQWSAVYDLTTGDIQVVVGREYTAKYNFHLEISTP